MGRGGLVEVDVEEIVEVATVKTSEKDQGAAYEPTTMSSSWVRIIVGFYFADLTRRKGNACEVVHVLVGSTPKNIQIPLIVVKGMSPSLHHFPLRLNILPLQRTGFLCFQQRLKVQAIEIAKTIVLAIASSHHIHFVSNCAGGMESPGAGFCVRNSGFLP